MEAQIRGCCGKKINLTQEEARLLAELGVTNGSVKTRVANAKFDLTFLTDDVEIVATYQLYNINRI